ncbi:MAG: hypothetical protein ACJ8MH_04630 [Povalibacter sp.]
MKCPKCGYERKSVEQAPIWQCPSCGIAYSKASRSAEVPAAVSAPRASARTLPATDPSTDDEKLSLAAGGQKIAIYCILLTFILNAGLRSQSVPAIVALALTLALGIYSLVGIVRICSGLDKSQSMKILFMIFAFVPLANIISLIYLSVRTTKLLRAAGFEVGLMGVKR